jgi:hypothetical protein
LPFAAAEARILREAVEPAVELAPIPEIDEARWSLRTTHVGTSCRAKRRRLIASWLP